MMNALLTVSVEVGNVGGASVERDLSAILSYRNVEQNSVLSKASIIFKDKLSTSSILQEAALNLLRTCKGASGLDDAASNVEQVKEAAKQAYSIKATFVDLESAGITGPSTCNSILGRSSGSWLVASRSGRDVPTSETLSVCLHDLFKTHNSWTSYIGHLEEANTLCEVPGLDNAPRMIMEILKDFNDIIPTWAEMFDLQQQQQLSFMQTQREYAHEMEELQRRQREDLDDNHLVAQSTIDKIMNAA